MEHLRDMVVVLPGITGSVLQKDGKDVWAPTIQAAWAAAASLGAALEALALGEDDPNVDDLGDGIRATRLVPDAHLIPGLVKIDGYSAMVRLITDTFNVQRGSISIDDKAGANFFEFPYDWRRDNRVVARQLKRLVDRRLPQWRTSSGAGDAKVILLAHSMGGLVARHYLELLEGWRDCRALVTFGTPYRGSLNALDFLVNGYKKAFLDLSEVMRSFTSVYQLLPIYPVVKHGESYHRVAELDELAKVDRKVDRLRAEAALRFHRDIEDAVAAHRKEAAYVEDGYRTVPVVGTRQDTFQSAVLSGGRLTASVQLPSGVDDRLADGDGTVPRLSAIPIELSEEYRDTFVPERHASLQRNVYVLDALRERLRQMQVKDLKKIRGPEISQTAQAYPALSLELADLYTADEPVQLKARLLAEQKSGEVAALPAAAVEGRIERLDADEPATLRRFQQEDGTWVLRLEDLPAGLYRCSVQATAAGSGVAPPAVHDLFAVAG